MKIGLDEAIRGAKRKIEFERKILCKKCDAKGGKRETCQKCGGSGIIREKVQTIFGTMEQSIACHQCEGSGTIIVEKCEKCHAKGKIPEKITKNIEIPRGIEDGMSIKMRGEGHEGKDGNGDLYITFSITNTEGGLERRGENLHFTLEISPSEAALGTKKTLNIPLIGKKEIHIKSGAQHGTKEIFKNE